MGKILVKFDMTNMTPEKYDAAVKGLEAAGLGSAKGREYHVAALKGDGMIIVDVWTSKEDFDAFGEKLKPVLQQAGLEMPPPTILQIHSEIK